jgi:hypothetical protein
MKNYEAPIEKMQPAGRQTCLVGTPFADSLIRALLDNGARVSGTDAIIVPMITGECC